MRGYIRLPAYNPGPQGINFEPLNRGLQAFGEARRENRLLQQQKDIGNALSTGGYGEAADKAFSMGDLRTGLSLTQAEASEEDRDYQRQRQAVADQRAAAAASRAAAAENRAASAFDDKRRDALVSRISGVAQLIRNEADPARKAQMMQAFARNPRIKSQLDSVGFDPASPDTTLDMIIAEARGLTASKPPEYQFTKYGVGNKATGEITPYPEGTVPQEDRGEMAKLEQSLRKEYSQLSQDFRSVRDGLERVRTGANLNTGAGDVATVFGFMRVLDPNSTVREGEFATAEQTAGLPGQVVSTYNRLVSGERLTPEQRQNFVNTAQALAQSKFQEQQRIQTQFGRISEAAGADPSRVLTDFGQPAQNASPPQTNQNDPFGILQPGE